MKIKQLISFGAIAALTLTGCNHDNDLNSTWDGKNGIVFSSSIKGMASRVNNNMWEQDDEVGVFMVNAGAAFEAAGANANKKYLASTDNKIEPAEGEGLYYPQNGNVDFYAYYPYQSALSGGVYKVNVENQTSLGAIDLIYAKKANVENGTASVPLVFDHKLTKLTFNIEKDATIDKLDGIKVKLSGLNTTADFNLATGELSGAATPKDIEMSVSTTGDKAAAIVLPGSISGAKAMFTLGTMTFEQELKATDFPAGSQVTVPVRVSINNGKPAITMGDATINDWATGPALDPIDVKFDGEGGNDTPSTPLTEINEPMTAGFGVFTVENEDLGGAPSPIWTTSDKFGAVAKAYIDGKRYAAKSRLVSPIIDLTNAEAPVLTFATAYNFASSEVATANLKVQVRVDDLTEEVKPWIDIAYKIGSGNYAFQDNTIDLSAYKGKMITLSFYYMSDGTATNTATWEIKNVVLKQKGETATPTEPGAGDGGTVTPGDGTMSLIFLEDFEGKELKSSTSIEKFDWSKNTTLTFTDSYNKADIRYLKNNSNNLWLPATTDKEDKTSEFVISNINTTGYTNLKLTYSIAVYNKNKDQNVIKVFAEDQEISVPSYNLPGNNEFKDITLDIPNGITTIRFFSNTTNKAGYRIDNIKLEGKK